MQNNHHFVGLMVRIKSKTTKHVQENILRDIKYQHKTLRLLVWTSQIKPNNLKKKLDQVLL